MEQIDRTLLKEKISRLLPMTTVKAHYWNGLKIIVNNCLYTSYLQQELPVI